MTRQQHEIKLSDPVSAWLHSQGFEPYAEVPHYESAIDLIGVRDDGETMEIICVELKMSLSWKVIKQAALNQLLSNRSYVAVASSPRESSLESCRREGIGALRVANNTVTVLLEPRDDDRFVRFHPRVATLRRYMQALGPGGVGGQACVKGEGPAQSAERAIEEYREKHPRATWREIWESIPNHYASEKSMAGAMRMVRERRRWAEILKRQRDKQKQLTGVDPVGEEGEG